MKINSITAGVALIALAGSVQMAKANITFEATDTGNVTGYFLSSSAGDTDLVGMLVNATTANVTIELNALIGGSGFYLNNHGSSFGASANLGSVNVNDSLVFVLWNQVTKKYILSDSILNDYVNGLTGGTDYIKSTSYIGSPLPSGTGTEVDFEDLLTTDKNPDFDYNDLDFVFQNVSLTPGPTSSPIPEPSTVVAGALLLLPFGVSTLRVLRNRKLASR